MGKVVSPVGGGSCVVNVYRVFVVSVSVGPYLYRVVYFTGDGPSPLLGVVACVGKR